MVKDPDPIRSSIHRRTGLRGHLPSTQLIFAALLFGALVAGAFVWSGAYDVGADAPHTRAVRSILDTLRERSIAARARDIAVPPDLGSAQRIAVGAGLYGEMCSGCHLGPGVEPSELSQGLYPQAPQLSKGDDMTAAEQFWTIKHGVKLTAMPAWGKTHSDTLIWDMVSFVRRLPDMSPEEYRRLVASAPEDHDAMMKEMGGGDHH